MYEVTWVEKIIVLETSGKHSEVYTAKVKFFDGEEAAELYCELVNEQPMASWWTRAKVIKADKEYWLGENDIYERS